MIVGNDKILEVGPIIKSIIVNKCSFPDMNTSGHLEKVLEGGDLREERTKNWIEI